VKTSKSRKKNSKPQVVYGNGNKFEKLQPQIKLKDKK
jgi:hypothetical protein